MKDEEGEEAIPLSKEHLSNGESHNYDVTNGNIPGDINETETKEEKSTNVIDAINPLGRIQGLMIALICLAICEPFYIFPQLAELEVDHYCTVPHLKARNWTDKEIRNLFTHTNESNLCVYEDLNYDYIANLTYEDATKYRETYSGNVTLKTCSAEDVEFDFESARYRLSVPAYFHLTCEKRGLIPLANSLFMMGSHFGMTIWGPISDAYGRRKTLCVAYTLLAIFAPLMSLSPNYTVYCILRCLTGCVHMGSYVIALVLMFEITNTKGRSMYYALKNMSNFVWDGSYVCLAYLIQDWRWLHLAISSPVVFLPLFWFFVPESPYWLLSKGRKEEAWKVLKRLAHINNVKSFNRDVFEKCVAEKLVSKSTEKTSLFHEFGKLFRSHLDPFRTPKLRKIALINCYMWFMGGIVFYGFVFSNVTLPGNVYTIAFFTAVIYLPCAVSFFVIIPRFGRKGSLIPLSICLSLCSLGVVLVLSFNRSKTRDVMSILLAVIGKGCANVTYSLLNIQTSELYPTVLRSVGQSLGNIGCALGSMCAPYISALGSFFWLPLPNLCYGILSLIALPLALMLPETANKHLPQTVDDVEKKQHFTEIPVKENDIL